MKHLILVIGMMAVTYVPRMAPLVLFRNMALPAFLRRFLKALPACALGALIVPDLLNAIPGKPLAALAGVAAAGAVSLTKGGLLLSVIVGVAVAYIVLSIGA